jgi:hypothetical protein
MFGALFLALVACGIVDMEDASSEPKYSKVIGKKIKVKEDVWAYGITLDPNYQRRVDLIRLVPGVGLSGPEIVTSGRLDSGTILLVERVLKAESPLFSRVDYVVREIGSNRFEGHELRIRLTGDVNDSNYGLDESIYTFE